MNGSNFKGVKRSEVELTHGEVAALLKDGRLHINVGTWDDGTPAFITLTTDRVKDKSQLMYQEVN